MKTGTETTGVKITFLIKTKPTNSDEDKILKPPLVPHNPVTGMKLELEPVHNPADSPQQPQVTNPRNFHLHKIFNHSTANPKLAKPDLAENSEMNKEIILSTHTA